MLVIKSTRNGYRFAESVKRKLAIMFVVIAIVLCGSNVGSDWQNAMIGMRREICEKCPQYKVVRGNTECPVFGRELMSKIQDPNAECSLGYWGKKEKEIIFYRQVDKTININNLWLGQKIFLLCNGPSRDNYNLDLLNQAGIMTMTINNGGHNFRSNFWVGQDSPIKFMDSIWLDPKIMKFTHVKKFRAYFWDQKNNCQSKLTVSDCPNVIYHLRKTPKNLKDWFDSEKIHWNTTKECGNIRSTMIAAIHILYALGFRTVYILGADFIMNSVKKYCFNQNSPQKTIRHNTRAYGCMLKFFEKMKPQFEKRNFKLINCGDQTKFNVLQYKPYEQAVQDCVIDTSASTEGMYEVKK